MKENIHASDNFQEIITKVEVQKRNKERCSIFVNQQFAFGCSMDSVLRFQLTKGTILTADLKRNIEQAEQNFSIKKQALAFATYKPRTEKQIRTALEKKEFADEEIDFALSFLREFGYVDDKRYAEAFVRDILLRKPAGTFKIRQELRLRGISEEIITSALRDFFPEDETLDLAIKAAEKKLRALSFKPPEKQKNSVVSYLQRQGFSWEIIKKVLQQLEL